jgi:hypothetical protein
MNENDVRSAIQNTFNRAYTSPASGFETRMQTALLRAAPAQALKRRPHLREGLAILAAVVAAVAVVAALVGPRLYTRSQQPAVVTSPSPSPPSPTPHANACRLPVVLFVTEGGPPYTAGFVDVATGRFSADTNVSFADLAFVTDGATISETGGVYDVVLQRWIPSDVLSPDQLSYAYVTIKGAASTLHTFDVVHHTDRVLWTLAGVRTTLSRWKADGIYAFTDDLSGGTAPPRYWRVDPQSGKATEINTATFNPYLRLLTDPAQYGTGMAQFGTSGVDPDRMIYATYTGSVGARHTTYFVIIDGKRTNIYTGVANDKKDFDPDNVLYDGSLLWFNNVDGKYLWSWTAASGLTRHSMHLPNVPFTGKRPAGYTIAGPCV